MHGNETSNNLSRMICVNDLYECLTGIVINVVWESGETEFFVITVNM